MTASLWGTLVICLLCKRREDPQRKADERMLLRKSFMVRHVALERSLLVYVQKKYVPERPLSSSVVSSPLGPTYSTTTETTTVTPVWKRREGTVHYITSSELPACSLMLPSTRPGRACLSSSWSDDWHSSINIYGLAKGGGGLYHPIGFLFKLSDKIVHTRPLLHEPVRTT